MKSINLSETVTVKVRFSEVDSIRMVWHGHYVKYLEDAREAFCRKYDLEYIYIFYNGYLAPMFDMKMRYHHIASLNDELLVTITYRHTRGAKLVFDYEIRRKSDDELILTAETTQLFITRDGVFEPSSPDFFTEWKKKNKILDQRC